MEAQANLHYLPPNHQITYSIYDRPYDTETLHIPDGSGDVGPIIMTIQPEDQFESIPIFVELENGYAILTTNHDDVFLKSYSDLDSPIISARRFNIPDLTLGQPDQDPFPIKLLPDGGVDFLLNYLPTHRSLSMLSLDFTRMIPHRERPELGDFVSFQNDSRSPSPRSPAQETNPQLELLQNAFDTLMRQLYGLPVELPQFLTVNGILSEFIPIERLNNLIQSNQIERFTIDPTLQAWAGSPVTNLRIDPLPNRILTFFGRNGQVYLVKAKYDPNINEIFRPN
jgi:hypothetical protein